MGCEKCFKKRIFVARRNDEGSRCVRMDDDTVETVKQNGKEEMLIDRWTSLMGDRDHFSQKP